jgi:hypothetical protein
MTSEASTRTLVGSKDQKWSERRLRLIGRRFGPIKEKSITVGGSDQISLKEFTDFTDSGAPARLEDRFSGDEEPFFVIGTKPSAAKRLKEFYKEDLKPLVDKKRGKDVTDRREERVRREPEPQDDSRVLGMGIVGELTQREIDPAILALPHVQWQLDNMSDFRPFFTYWISFVQVVIMIIALCVYGLGPRGFGLSHVSGMVMTKWLSLEQVDVHSPTNIWIGPSSSDLVHLATRLSVKSVIKKVFCFR